MSDKNQGARVMDEAEAHQVEMLWNASDEKRRLDARQEKLVAAIALKSAAYSNRC